MIGDVQQKIVKLRNELQAQKVSAGVSYSQLLMPENTPTLDYSGSASWTSSTTGLIARIRYRFTRTDGLMDPPFINFAYNADYSPTYKEFAIANGFSFSQGNVSYFDYRDIEAYIYAVGDGYVDFYIDWKNSIKNALFSLNSVTITASCQAISNVYGTLSVERLI